MSGALVELRVACSEEQVESLSDILEACGAVSVAVDDADAGTAHEQAMFGEPGLPAPAQAWQHSRVSALFDSDAAARRAWGMVEAGLRLALVPVFVPVPEQDWVRQTQVQFQPVPITPEFWIVPSWHEPPAAARRVLRLDPGLAFGTGTHPTTRMCLRWIATQAADRMLGRVLDYGCGSGILALAAAIHGAREVIAVDVDDDAVAATRANAQANGQTLTVGAPDQVQGYFDVVLANILASPLKVLAPLLVSRLAPGGRLVLAGILERQADELQAAYAPHCALTVADAEDGWILMTTTTRQGR